jgi:hypothetical protein
MTKKKPVKKSIYSIKPGQAIIVYWDDIVMHDHIELESLDLDKITRVKPTETHGKFLGIKNRKVVISLEFCHDAASDATMLETIPIGCIIWVEVMTGCKVIGKKNGVE